MIKLFKAIGALAVACGSMILLAVLDIIGGEE